MAETTDLAAAVVKAQERVERTTTRLEKSNRALKTLQNKYGEALRTFALAADEDQRARWELYQAQLAMSNGGPQ